MEKVLTVELMNEDEDVVDADGEHEEGDDLGDDQRDFDTNCRKQPDGG